MALEEDGFFCAGCTCEEEDDTFRSHLRYPAVTLAQAAFDERELTEAPLYAAPKVKGFPTYSSAPDQPLLGVPIREGGLWHLSTQDRFEPVTYALYVNGFSFSTQDGLEASVSLSPFSLVRNCRFQSGACSQLKSFKVSLLDHDPCCYFAVRSICEREAEEERSDWVLGISHTILLITDSILPNYISCDPVPDLPVTYDRLLAGYLIHRDDAGSISVLFCELHAHKEELARFVLYENQTCATPIMDIIITESSVCCDIVGINCSCFVVDSHHFASQTPSERKLWLRALSNVKVKIQNKAPQPTDDELQYYRDSIREHILAMQATQEPRISSDPLLNRCSRKSLHVVGDGDLEPPAAPPADDIEARTYVNHVSL
jgi:hypothetical protein